MFYISGISSAISRMQRQVCQHQALTASASNVAGDFRVFCCVDSGVCDEESEVCDEASEVCDEDSEAFGDFVARLGKYVAWFDSESAS